jgi:catechol 2,3-dioxygenase-like lactoylglutathione lyase family enzyme
VISGHQSAACQDGDVEILSSRILLRPADLGRSQRFYRDVLGLAVYREFGPPTSPGIVFFLGAGLLEVSGHSDGTPEHSLMIWLQVRDIHSEHERLAAAGVPILRRPVTESWGLTEMWIEDPDGVRIVLVEVPSAHPLRRDPRSSPQAT